MKATLIKILIALLIIGGAVVKAKIQGKEIKLKRNEQTERSN
jgi:hypothetical protein